MRGTALERLAHWAADLRLESVPDGVREHAVHQLLSTVGAVFSGFASELGPALERAFPAPAPGAGRILPRGSAAPPVHAALVMAAFSMVLDFDDVLLGGHTGHSSVLVPLAFAGSGRFSGADLLLAQITANEVAARVNMVCAVGATRGQMATHLHLLGAAAARAKLEGLDGPTFAAALNFALSYPAEALFPAFLGSDAKALAAAWPIRMGCEAVDAVRAGLRAPRDILDDRRGFFAKAALVPVREFLGGLGERWHTATNSYKLYPACGYLASALDAALALVREVGFRGSDVVSVVVEASIFTVGMDAHSAPYLDGRTSPVAALTFSTPFVIASALLAGEFTPSQLARPWIERREVWELAARVESRHDLGLTVTALTSDIPLGAALRRTRRWQAAAFGLKLAAKAFGRAAYGRRLPETLRLAARLASAAGVTAPPDFAAATKPLGARVRITLADGRELTREVLIPRGFAGAQGPGPDGRGVRALMRDKVLTTASPLLGPERAAELAAGLEGFARLTPAELGDLLAVASLEPTHGPAGDNPSS